MSGQKRQFDCLTQGEKQLLREKVYELLGNGVDVDELTRFSMGDAMPLLNFRDPTSVTMSLRHIKETLPSRFVQGPFLCTTAERCISVFSHFLVIVLHILHAQVRDADSC